MVLLSCGVVVADQHPIARDAEGGGGGGGWVGGGATGKAGVDWVGVGRRRRALMVKDTKPLAYPLPATRIPAYPPKHLTPLS